MTNRERVLEALMSSLEPLDDDQIARRAGISPRQTVNRLCRELEDAGVIRRVPGRSGKTVNQIIGDRQQGRWVGPTPRAGRDDLADADASAAMPVDQIGGDSREQREAEALMLSALGERLGLSLAPRRLLHPSGARVEIDGADENLTVLAECWAHQGTAKVAQKYKLVVDATKLNWIAKSLTPAPSRLILCVSDPAAVAHLAGSSWQAQAIRELGVEVEIVSLAPSTVSALTEAQKRQYR
jgi:DprA/Smf-like nucleotide binding protein involved in DNA uptake